MPVLSDKRNSQYSEASPRPVWGAQGTVGCDGDALGVTVLDQFFLSEVRVTLDLQEKTSPSLGSSLLSEWLRGPFHTRKDEKTKCNSLIDILQTRPRNPTSLSILNTDLRDETLQTVLNSWCWSRHRAGPTPNRAYLVGHWLMFQSRLVQEPFNLEVVEVGDTQSFHQPLVHQFLHGLSQGGPLFRSVVLNLPKAATL